MALAFGLSMPIVSGIITVKLQPASPSNKQLANKKQRQESGVPLSFSVNFFQLGWAVKIGVASKLLHYDRGDSDVRQKRDCFVSGKISTAKSSERLTMAEKKINGVEYKVDPLPAPEGYSLLSEMIVLAGPGFEYLPAILRARAQDESDQEDDGEGSGSGFMGDLAAASAVSSMIKSFRHWTLLLISKERSSKRQW